MENNNIEPITYGFTQEQIASIVKEAAQEGARLGCKYPDEFKGSDWGVAEYLVERLTEIHVKRIINKPIEP